MAYRNEWTHGNVIHAISEHYDAHAAYALSVMVVLCWLQGWGQYITEDNTVFQSDEVSYIELPGCYEWLAQLRKRQRGSNV